MADFDSCNGYISCQSCSPKIHKHLRFGQPPGEGGQQGVHQAGQRAQELGVSRQQILMVTVMVLVVVRHQTTVVGWPGEE